MTERHASVAPMQRLGKARAVLVTTFKRDGTPIATPVWGYRDHETFYFSSQASSGKVKRLRHTTTVQLATCTQRGKPTSPSWDGCARLLNADETAQVVRRKRHRYPILRLPMGAINSDQVGVAITLVPAASEQ